MELLSRIRERVPREVLFLVPPAVVGHLLVYPLATLPRDTWQGTGSWWRLFWWVVWAAVGAVLVRQVWRSSRVWKGVFAAAALAGVVTALLRARDPSYPQNTGPWEGEGGLSGYVMQHGPWTLGVFADKDDRSAELAFAGYQEGGELVVAEGWIFSSDPKRPSSTDLPMWRVRGSNPWHGLGLALRGDGSIQAPRNTGPIKGFRPVPDYRKSPADALLAGLWKIEEPDAAAFTAWAYGKDVWDVYRAERSGTSTDAPMMNTRAVPRSELLSSLFYWDWSNDEQANMRKNRQAALDRWYADDRAYIAIIPGGQGRFLGRMFRPFAGAGWPLHRLDLRVEGQQVRAEYTDQQGLQRWTATGEIVPADEFSFTLKTTRGVLRLRRLGGSDLDQTVRAGCLAWSGIRQVLSGARTLETLFQAVLGTILAVVVSGIVVAMIVGNKGRQGAGASSGGGASSGPRPRMTPQEWAEAESKFRDKKMINEELGRWS